MCQCKPKAVRASCETKAQCWLWHWQFSPALGKSPRNFCGFSSFLMSLMLRMPLSLRAQPAVFLAWLCMSGLHDFQGSQRPRHLCLLICKTGIIQLISGSSVDQYLQNTLKNERCCLSTECWPQNLQAVFLKHFIPFHIKASYLQAQPTSAVG